MIRPAGREDIGAITRIYRQAVLEGTGSFELEPPDEAAMAARYSDVVAAGLPYLVAATSTAVLGFAYAALYRPRAAFRFTLEDSVYVDASTRARGIGSALLVALVDTAEALGYRQMVAVIGDSANLASVRLHSRVGFRPAGTLRATGWKHGRWLDVVMMQRELGAGARLPPASA